MLQGIVYMIVVGLCWTSFGIVMGWAPKKKVDVGIMLFFSSILAMIVCGTISLIQGFPVQCPAREFIITFSALFICGALNYVQLDWMSRAMECGPNGIIWSLIQCSFIFPFLFGVFFFHAGCTFLKITGAVLVILALGIMGLSKDNSGDSKGIRWKLFAFASLCSTGIAQILSNMPSYYPEAEVISSSWRSAFFAFGLCIGTVIGSILVLKKTLVPSIKVNLKNRNMWIFCIVLQGFEILASIFLLYPGMNLLAQAGVGAIAYPLVVASGIVGFEIYSLVILREKRTLWQNAAFVMTILGIIALCGK